MNEQLQSNQELPPLSRVEMDSWQAPQAQDFNQLSIQDSGASAYESTKFGSVEQTLSPEQSLHQSRVKRFGRAILKFSAYSVQALHIGKEQIKSYGLGATASTASFVSEASHFMAPKLGELADRRGQENKWRSASGAVLKATSRGLTKLAPTSNKFARDSLKAYENSYMNSEFYMGGGALTKEARRYTRNIDGHSPKIPNRSDYEQMHRKRNRIENRLDKQKPPKSPIIPRHSRYSR
jgi:hypothetical protein